MLACVLCPHPSAQLSAQSKNQLNIQLSNGLIVSMTPRPGWSFVLAELIIPIHDAEMNPLIPRLTGENIFDRTLLDNDTSLTNGLLRLGGDYQIDYRPDEIRLSINFPSDQIRDFASLLQDLFTYKSFSLKRFDFSRLTFFDRFRSEPDWVFQLARAFAYARFFPNHPSARGPVQSNHLEKMNLSYIRSFYSRIFKPERSLLVMNGDLNPHTTYGLIEMTLNELRKTETSFPSRTTSFPKPEENRRIICLEAEQFDQLNAFVFSVIPPVHELEHFQERILHTHLFSIPHGRLFALTGATPRLRPIDFTTQLYHHSNLSLITTEFRFTQHLGRLLDMLMNERRRILQRPFDEREYLVASNILLGRMKVETARFDVFTAQSLHPIVSNRPVPFLENPAQLLRTNNYIKTVQFLGKKTGRQSPFPTYSPELIIITGSPAIIEQFKRTLSPILLGQLETITLKLE